MLERAGRAGRRRHRDRRRDPRRGRVHRPRRPRRHGADGAAARRRLRARRVRARGRGGRARATPGLVATVGRLSVEPGAPNVIPGRARRLARRPPRRRRGPRRTPSPRCASAPPRSPPRRDVALAWEERMATPAVAMDPALTGAARRGGRRARRSRTSGCRAAPATTPSRWPTLTGTAMLFVRCAGGVSHHPDESVDARRRGGRDRRARPASCACSRAPDERDRGDARLRSSARERRAAATPGHSQRSKASPGR